MELGGTRHISDDDRSAETEDDNEDKKDIGPAFDDRLTAILNTPAESSPPVEPEPDE